jgi:hypothetical protein
MDYQKRNEYQIFKSEQSNDKNNILNSMCDKILFLWQN